MNADDSNWDVPNRSSTDDNRKYWEKKYANANYESYEDYED